MTPPVSGRIVAAWFICCVLSYGSGAPLWWKFIVAASFGAALAMWLDQ